MIQQTRSDREASIASPEYLWDTDELTEVHHYVTPPIVRTLRSQGASRVLDLGCGNGALSGLLAARGFDVHGLDFSESGVELARRNHPDVQFERHDIGDPIPDRHIGQYDAVIAVEVIEHLLMPRALMSNAVAALRPGGVFLLTTPFHGYWKNLALALFNKYDYHWHPLRDFGHVKFFSKPTIIALFEEFGFHRLRFETVGRIPQLARSMIVSGVTPP